MVVGVIGFDQVCQNYIGFLVMLSLEVEGGFQGDVSILTSTFAFGGGSIYWCFVLCFPGVCSSMRIGFY